MDYNKHMDGVHKVDQQLNGLHTLHKSYKWYTKCVFRLMLQVTLNAHKLYGMKTSNHANALNF